MIDSISHITWLPYFDMIRRGCAKQTVEKFDRDYRDISQFPEIREDIEPVCAVLKTLLIELGKNEY